MGIHDREYYRATKNGNALARITSTAIGTIILINVVVWLLQVFTKKGLDPGPITSFLVASPGEVFSSFQVWRVVTAVFAHDPDGLWHIAFNMLVLFFVGREIESMLGTKEFWIFYLTAGVLSVLAEIIVMQLTGSAGAVLGASGSVMAVFVLLTLFYPTRTVLIYFVVPVPIWLLCALFVLGDLSSALSMNSNGVANFAHLMGAVYAVFFKQFDLRWSQLSRRFGRGPRRPKRQRVRARAAAEGKIVPFRGEAPRDASHETREVSERIDILLAKISADGQDSLTEEELEFLRENSGRYRSPDR